jgi:hypothetical protein
MLAQVSNGDGKQVVFSSMPAEADRQRDQLRGVIDPQVRDGLPSKRCRPEAYELRGVRGKRSFYPRLGVE